MSTQVAVAGVPLVAQCSNLGQGGATEQGSMQKATVGLAAAIVQISYEGQVKFLHAVRTQVGFDPFTP